MPSKPIRILIAVGLLMAAVLIAWLVHPMLTGQSTAPGLQSALVAQAIPTPAEPVAPSFDIVRVSPGGSAILAGRGAPGASVTVLNSGKPIGTARADASGAWTLVPTAPIAPGAAELTLSSQSATGPAVAGLAPVLLVIPPADAPAPITPLVVLAPPTGSSRILQGLDRTPGKLGLDTVDYDEHGAIRFSGTAPPHMPVRVYVDTAPVGDAQADAAGHWALSPTQLLKPGVHRLRLDQLGPNGRVASRVELPFLRETLVQAQVPPGAVVVQPQENLWRLARRAYGNGIRYTVIYQANRNQIRDPRLIYVGQVFNVPAMQAP